MGVKSCSRDYCNSIMCDTHIDGIGYVCRECQEEFKEYLQSERLTPSTEGDISRCLKVFMKIPKDSFTKGEEKTVDEFFASYTKDF